jgi:hypothetical protein
MLHLKDILFLGKTHTFLNSLFWRQSFLTRKVRAVTGTVCLFLVEPMCLFFSAFHGSTDLFVFGGQSDGWRRIVGLFCFFLPLETAPERQESLNRSTHRYVFLFFFVFVGRRKR